MAALSPSALVECSVLLVLLFPQRVQRGGCHSLPSFSSDHTIQLGFCVLIKVFFWGLGGEFCHVQAPLICKHNAEALEGPA